MKAAGLIDLWCKDQVSPVPARDLPPTVLPLPSGICSARSNPVRGPALETRDLIKKKRLNKITSIT